MKVFRIKTNDFAKLTNNKNLLTTEQKTALEKYQNALGIKAEKFLPRGKDIVLIIAGGKYYITCKPAYQTSLIKILESVDIVQDDIAIMNRTTTTTQDLTVEQLKNLLLN